METITFKYKVQPWVQKWLHHMQHFHGLFQITDAHVSSSKAAHWHWHTMVTWLQMSFVVAVEVWTIPTLAIAWTLVTHVPGATSETTLPQCATTPRMNQETSGKFYSQRLLPLQTFQMIVPTPKRKQHQPQAAPTTNSKQHLWDDVTIPKHLPFVVTYCS